MIRRIKLVRKDSMTIDLGTPKAMTAGVRVYCVDGHEYVCEMDAGDYSITRMEYSMDQANVTADDMVHMIYALADGRKIKAEAIMRADADESK
jgi:hypothetical protein